MRVDDETGPFDWIHVANEFGFKPWAGLFIDAISEGDAADLSALVNSGQATAAVHAFGDDAFFYYDHEVGPWPDATMANNFARGTQWHQAHSIPIAKYVVPHFYEMGTNVFAGLRDWGVEFVGIQMDPGRNYYGSSWIQNGPYRRFETESSDSTQPFHYADFVTVPNHPEFSGQFFNCVTEIRDDASYEWLPTDDVSSTTERGARQLRRALDSRVVATLFTHGYYIPPIAPQNWREIIQGISDYIAPYHPVYLTMDDAARYVRAIRTSSIVTSTYDPIAQTVDSALAGTTDVATKIYLYTSVGGEIEETSVDVPVFSGSTLVIASIGPGGGGDTTPPQISALTAGDLTTGGATITWTTNEAATSQIEYGLSTAYGQMTTPDSTLAFSHTQALSGLSAATLYHYRVLSRDAAGNLATSADATLTTQNPKSPPTP